jgi:hypothetical protein
MKERWNQLWFVLKSFDASDVRPSLITLQQVGYVNSRRNSRYISWLATDCLHGTA